MRSRTEHRTNPRLRLSYPIEVFVRELGSAGGTRGVTTNLSARGAYFKTFTWGVFREGGRVEVKILVPHPLRSGEDSIQLHMKTEGTVRRMEEIVGREALGEDGLTLKGVALKFDAPLSFNYFWA